MYLIHFYQNNLVFILAIIAININDILRFCLIIFVIKIPIIKFYF